MCTRWNKKMQTIIMGYLHLIAEVWIWRYLFIIINHQIKSKKVKRNMESNITKSLLKKFWKRWVTLPLNSSYGLPFWCSLSLMTPPPPSEAPALPSPRKKFNVVVYYFLFVNNVESSTLFPSSRKKIWAAVIVNTITFRKICLLTGLLIFRAVADPRNSHKNAKYCQIRQKYFQIHVAKTYLILILAIRPVLFTPNVQI